MFNYLDFKDKTLLITPDKLKTKIREEIMSLNTLLDIKIMSISEVKNRLLFDYDNRAIYYIYKNYNKPLSIIKNLINYMYYIDINSEYKSHKLNELKEIKINLIKNKLLKFDKRFIYNLNQYNIKFLGFPLLTKEDNFILNELNKYSNVEVLNYYTESFNHDFIHAKNIEDEIIFVAESISNLIKIKDNEPNVDINNIKLCNVNEDYTFYLKRIFENYNLALNLDEATSLYDLPLTLEFINLLKDNSKEETIDILKEKYPNYNEYINEYIKLLNDYSFNKTIDLDVIIYELKNIKIKNKVLSNSIELIDIEEVGNSTDHIFVLSCNYGCLPKIHKDEDYLIDKEKNELGISTSKDINKNNIDSITKLIKSSKNIYLSYKDRTYFNEFHKIDYLNDFKVKDFNKNTLSSFSKNEDMIRLAKNFDKDLKDEETLILNNNYEIKYRTYDNSFKGISKESLDKFLDNKPLSISYSSLNTYYKCGFRFYLNNILKLSKFEDSVNTIIGNIMHEIVEKCFDKIFDFEIDFEIIKNKNIKDVPLKESELFFIDNLKERSLQVVEYLKECEDYTSLNNKIYEKSINFYKEHNDYKFYINGYIDKLIFNEIDNVIYSAIIDMKTNNDKIDPSLFEFGLGLQLPFYIYLLRNDEKDLRFRKAKILGIYIHNILNKDNSSSSLRLNGYTVKDFKTLPIIDNTYSSSKLIKSLSITKEGEFDKNAKLITEEDIKKYEKIVEEKIINLMDSIINRKFNIDPKIYEKKQNRSSDTCTYCEYKNICYKSLKDFIILRSSKDGDSNVLD